LAFAQLTFRESLRDIERCLRAVESKLYHAGFRGKIARSTLADANRTHDWRIFADLAHVLIGRARRLYSDEPLGVELEQTVYALDSTTIDLCLSLFPWAQFRRRKGAVKLHTLLDLRGNIPCFVRISHGKTHDVTALDHLPIEPGSFYVMDRGYIDFRRLYRFTTCSAFFVTRAKRGLDLTRRARRPVDKATGLRSDQTIVLAGPRSSRQYPDPLRRIAFCDAEIGIGGASRLLPSHTTGHTGPYTAVRSSSAVGGVTRRSPGFGDLASPGVIRSLPDRHLWFHPDPPSGRPVGGKGRVALAHAQIIGACIASRRGSFLAS
jgi:hypothetical protein